MLVSSGTHFFALIAIVICWLHVYLCLSYLLYPSTMSSLRADTMPILSHPDPTPTSACCVHRRCSITPWSGFCDGTWWSFIPVSHGAGDGTHASWVPAQRGVIFRKRPPDHRCGQHSWACTAPKPTFRLSPENFDLQLSEGLFSLLSLSQSGFAQTSELGAARRARFQSQICFLVLPWFQASFVCAMRLYFHSAF